MDIIRERKKEGKEDKEKTGREGGRKKGEKKGRKGQKGYGKEISTFFFLEKQSLLLVKQECPCLPVSLVYFYLP